MPRFEDFDAHELRVISEALEWSQAEFDDPGHTREDRDTLQTLIREAKEEEAEAKKRAPDPGPWEWPRGIRTVMGELQIVGGGTEPKHDDSVSALPYAVEAAKRNRETASHVETVGGFDRGGHPIIRKPDGTTERMAAKKPTRPRMTTEEPQEAKEYRGFLLIECEECGDRHAFCAKIPMSRYRCGKCGTWTTLNHMSHLRVICECGHRYSYTTNVVTDKVMDVNCLHCGAPVSVEWCGRRQRYEPVDWSQKKRTPQNKGKRKKGGRK